MWPVRLLSRDAQESSLTFKRPSYLFPRRGSAREGARRPGPRDMAGWRMLGRDPSVAPVPSPLAQLSRWEVLR